MTTSIMSLSKHMSGLNMLATRKSSKLYGSTFTVSTGKRLNGLNPVVQISVVRSTSSICEQSLQALTTGSWRSRTISINLSPSGRCGVMRPRRLLTPLISFSCRGPCQIIQCDRGAEFKAAVAILMRRHGIKIVYSSPRHPKSQGLSRTSQRSGEKQDPYLEG
jgi:hypothetical protein